MDGHFILELLTLVAVFIGGGWIYDQSIQRRFKTMWERKDQQDKENLAIFVKKEIYENDQKHLKERNDDRFENVMRFVKDRFDTLAQKIDELKEVVKNNSHKE